LFVIVGKFLFTMLRNPSRSAATYKGEEACSNAPASASAHARSRPLDHDSTLDHQLRPPSVDIDRHEEGVRSEILSSGSIRFALTTMPRHGRRDVGLPKAM
jgi:hypothetical protein